MRRLGVLHFFPARERTRHFARDRDREVRERALTGEAKVALDCDRICAWEARRIRNTHRPSTSFVHADGDGFSIFGIRSRTKLRNERSEWFAAELSADQQHVT